MKARKEDDPAVNPAGSISPGASDHLNWFKLMESAGAANALDYQMSSYLLIQWLTGKGKTIGLSDDTGLAQNYWIFGQSSTFTVNAGQ
ncbi:hypothetical protein [Actinacidiphila rubida]|uniref:Uncharacterized protein n=1 Tax=Actinacidiphila rubida TaxID=310780 RepID=A0A1H8RAQ9_9ACTN|nr:hypothetical protein [Actinacidiphila rubida]SEO63491.1 hypothetical protein SAMN05216267_103392 [Actinacidiphila rubida]SEP00310.1 hypothetical protein SAMN05216267_10688 [Actinacidiphila rubida]